MQYLLIINKDEAKYRALTDAQRTDLEKRYADYGMKMLKAGILRGGAKLEHTHTATTVRVREGKRLTTDGPFAELAEQVAGVAILEVDNLDQALEWAAGHPDAEWASVEVRPIQPWQQKPE